jgi:D-alanyl-D-alanine carboxypeptidase
MNRFARILNMDRTNFACVHGLPNRLNVSCARDIGLLSTAAMRSEKFAEIVKTQEYISESAMDSH